MLMRSVWMACLIGAAVVVFGAGQAGLLAATAPTGSSAAAKSAAAAKTAASPAPGGAAATPSGAPGKAATTTAGKAAASSTAAARADSTSTASAASAKKDVRISGGQSALLGLIQGLTEYLPVSSTGHLILANYALGLSEFSPTKVGPLGRVMEDNQAVDDFDIILHLGTWLAVLGLYRKRVWQMVKGVVGKEPGGAWLLLMLIVAFVPAAGAGFLWKKPIEQNLYNPLTVALALAVGGGLMIAVEAWWRKHRRADRITDVTRIQLWQAVVIGLAQGVALWPGTSRSMMTIIAALVVGLDMLAAAEFSFLLALPTLGAAVAYTGLKHGKDMMQTVAPEAMAIGLVVTTVVAFFVMKALLKWLTRHGLSPFGYYRIALAAVIYVYFFVINA